MLWPSAVPSSCTEAAAPRCPLARRAATCQRLPLWVSPASWPSLIRRQLCTCYAAPVKGLKYICRSGLPCGPCRRRRMVLLQGFQVQQLASGTICTRTGPCKHPTGKLRPLRQVACAGRCNEASSCAQAHAAAKRAAVHAALSCAGLQPASVTLTSPLRAFAAVAQAPPSPTFARSAAPTPAGSGCQVANCVGCRGAPTNCYLCKPVSPCRCPSSKHGSRF
jgi:hypothetical protein